MNLPVAFIETRKAEYENKVASCIAPYERINLWMQVRDECEESDSLNG